MTRVFSPRTDPPAGLEQSVRQPKSLDVPRPEDAAGPHPGTIGRARVENLDISERLNLLKRAFGEPASDYVNAPAEPPRSSPAAFGSGSVRS
jgi:hypothetical protein